MNQLKEIRLNIVINKNDIAELFKYFDFVEEYDNKVYKVGKYVFDYGFGIRTYSNTKFILDVETINETDKYILRNCEYVVAREIFNKNELTQLEQFCPCSKCLSLNIENVLSIHREMFAT